MDKVLAFSILSASPADLAAGAGAGAGAGGRWARLSWRRGADDRQGEPAARQERDNPEGARPHGGDSGKKKTTEPPRFALELDGIDCFETIVSH